MNAYYEQIAQNIFPILGVNSMEEAQQFASGKGRIVETADAVWMNPNTGSVDFASNWLADVGADDESELSSDHGLIEVTFDAESESWVAA